MLERLHNIAKKDKKRPVGEISESSPPKKGRPQLSSTSEKHLYPVVSAMPPADMVTYGRNLEALRKELGKAKPRRDVVLSLMEATFRERRDYILVDTEDISAKAILEKWPALKLNYVVRCLLIVYTLKYDKS